MTVLDLLLGRPLASDESRGEQIGSLVGIPIFGSDALSSAAYGPEATLTGGYCGVGLRWFTSWETTRRG
jgi:hypothetical protein